MNQNITDKDVIIDYYRRLTTPYKKHGVKKFFITQFLKGDGHELESHFWSKHSSSRLAFELYSWLANEDCIKDIEFEYKLKGIKGSPKSPNMDVFIETEDKVIFIESKFTETYTQNIESLPDAYYKEKGEAKNTNGNLIKSTLSERYFSNEISTKFINFKNYIDDNLFHTQEPQCWMDYAQEFKHLVGIYLFLTKNATAKRRFKNKKIEFYNVFYKKDIKTNNDIESFFNEGQKLMNELLKREDFVYESITTQDIISKIQTHNSDLTAFASNRQIMVSSLASIKI